MRMKEKGFIYKHKSIIILSLIILIGMIKLIYLFSLRDGHHVDETWSYGYANSFFMPHVFGGYYDYEIRNLGEWVKGEEFKDYITVSYDERFRFDSVMYNKQDDLSPVLYAFILHFVCSLFPETFSWTYAFVISLFFYVPSVILVYSISKEFTGSENGGLLCSLFYIFSGCGTANFLYLRVYHLMTFLSLLLFWVMYQIYSGKKDKKPVLYVSLVAVVLLGCLTHYYYLVIAFFITAYFAIGLLIKKKFKRFISLISVTLGSVVLYFIIYRPALNKLLPYLGIAGGESLAAASTTGYYNYPYSWDLRISNIHFFGGTIGFSIDFDPIVIFELFVGFLTLVFICGMMAFLFRNELFMKKIVRFIKNVVLKSVNAVGIFAKKMNGAMLVALLASVSYLVVIPYSARIYGMGHVERYYFAAMSLFIVFFVSFIYLLFGEISKKLKKCSVKILTFVFVLCMACLCLLSNRYIGGFFFMGMKEKELISEVEGKDCFIYARFMRDMIWLSPIIQDSDDVFITLPEMYEDPDFEIPKLDEGTLILVFNEGFITEEQRSEMEESGGTFSVLNSTTRPDEYITLNEFIKKLEENSGLFYELIGEYETNVGDLSLFRSVVK